MENAKKHPLVKAVCKYFFEVEKEINKLLKPRELEYALKMEK